MELNPQINTVKQFIYVSRYRSVNDTISWEEITSFNPLKIPYHRTPEHTPLMPENPPIHPLSPDTYNPPQMILPTVTTTYSLDLYDGLVSPIMEDFTTLPNIWDYFYFPYKMTILTTLFSWSFVLGGHTDWIFHIFHRVSVFIIIEPFCLSSWKMSHFVTV